MKKKKVFQNYDFITHQFFFLDKPYVVYSLFCIWCSG